MVLLFPSREIARGPEFKHNNKATENVYYYNFITEPNIISGVNTAPESHGTLPLVVYPNKSKDVI